MSFMKNVSRPLFKLTPFYPSHIGNLVRNTYFWKYTETLPWKNFTKILDAGCGGGEYAKKLSRRFTHLEIYACDIKKYRSWNDSPKNVNFRQQDLLKLGDQNCYDFCLNIDVLEHISQSYKVLQNIYRALKVGGYFYPHTPRKNESRILPKRFFKEFDHWAKEEHVGQMYELEELKNIMISIGFEIVETRETFGFFGSFAWEIDRITDKYLFFKVILMPLLKLFAHFDVKFSRRGNGILILAMKS